MKDQKNILNYGFLIFLIIIGILSFFKKDDAFVNAINSLSLPIFLFTISTLIVKSNQYIKNSFSKAISDQEEIIELSERLIKSEEKMIEMKKSSNEDITQDKINLADTIGKSVHSLAYSNGLHRCFIFMHTTTIIVNIVAMFSFVFCLLSLVGLFPALQNHNWINIFSLILVFFDFFVFEDVMKVICDKAFKKIRKNSDERVEKEYEQN